MKRSIEGEKLVKEYESLRLKAYLDSGGVPTIGYGTTKYLGKTPVKIGDVITKKRAEELFWFDCDITDKSIPTDLTITQRQYDALFSFVYNVGKTQLMSSTLFKEVRKNPNSEAVGTQWVRWVKDKGKVVEGLRIRRNKELAYYKKL